MATKKQVQPREELEQQDQHKHKHQPVVSNGLKIKLDHLKTFKPLTEKIGRAHV